MNKCAIEILCFNEVVIAFSHRHKAHIKLRNKESHTHTYFRLRKRNVISNTWHDPHTFIMAQTSLNNINPSNFPY